MKLSSSLLLMISCWLFIIPYVSRLCAMVLDVRVQYTASTLSDVNTCVLHI